MKKLAYSLTFSLLLIVSMASGSLGAIMGDYHSLPPFLTTSVPPNLLLLIDNSASMYDLAYVSDQKYCYDDSYTPTTTYAGYCEPDKYYIYDLTDMQFEEAADQTAAKNHLLAATGTKYGADSIANPYVGIAIDETVNPKVVTAFVAKGNFINWAMASKFDIEKKILTGGKLETTGTYGAPNDRLVMESRGCLNRRFIKEVAVLDAGSNTFYLTLGIVGPKEPTFPIWENATAYVVGDVVSDVGDLYIATSSGTSNGNGVADDTGVSWAAYTLTRWTDGAVYPANSIVIDNGEMYITALGGTANGTGVADDTGITDWDDYNVTHIEILPVLSVAINDTACQNAITELQKAVPNQGQLKQYIDDCMGYVQGSDYGSDAHAAFNHGIHNCWYYAKHGDWQPGGGSVSAMQSACEKIYADWGIPPWSITTDDRSYPCFGIWDNDPDTPDDPPTGYVGRCWKPGTPAACTCTQWESPAWKCLPAVAPDPACCKKWDCPAGAAGGWDAAGWADVDTCILEALHDYCGIFTTPEVVDPTDQAGETGEFWNIPAVLIDSGAVAQKGEPLTVLKGYVEQTAVPTGLIQEYAGEAHMGIMSFNDEGSKSECIPPFDPYILYKCTDASNRDGAQVTSSIGSATATLVSDINDIDAFAWTPIAEAMYNAIGYYTQNATRRLDPLDFSLATDPVTEWCQANNVLIITDGASTADQAPAISTLVASVQTDTDTDPATCGSLAGSPLLDDLTWYAKQGTNIYPAGNELVNGEPKQPITTYIVVAGSMRSTGSGDECSPEILLENAADNGRGVADPAAVVSLYQATDLSELETKLREAFEAILGGASSGTAASVVSAARRGEGALYQAVFYVTYEDDNGTEIEWIGKLHSLFVDQYGNMREDTNGNFTLDLSTDKLITLVFDPSAGRTKAYRDSDSDSDGEADGSPTLIEIDEIEYLWEGGKMLAERTASTRNIYTWIDENNDGVVGGGSSLDTGEYITFDDSSASDLQRYLAVDVAGTTETTKLINWIRGTDQTGYRSRTIDIDGTNRVWKLGDIIYSTPTVIGMPKEKYEFLYGDASYKTFKNKYAPRRNVIYVGANDGMLHAFNAGFYDEANAKFEVGTGTPSYSGATPALGEELWAYIPYNLLPHLRWLKDPLYTHVYYVDLKPKVIDAQIFTPDTVHPGGWGTVLFCGMRFGGGQIDVSEADVGYDWDGDTIIESGVTRSFGSAYFALDITDPESPPSLLWEFTDPNLGFTTSYPAVVHVDHSNNDWWIAFGSGPTDYDGTSTQLGRTYVLKLASGTQPNNSPIGTNWGGANTSAMGDVMSVDTDINDSQCVSGSCTYTPDVFYIGCSQGTMWRISCIGVNWAGTQTPLVSLGNTKPIISAPSASQDNDHRLWIYFGTGQFYHENDKSNTDDQSLVGVKEPLDWNNCTGLNDPTQLTISCNACMSAVTVPSGNLLDVTDYSVFLDGTVDTDGDLVGETLFDDFVEDIKQTTSDTDVPKHYDGWILDITGGERCFSKPTVLGGIITFTTFEPDDDACAFEGEGYLYALFYKTGTAFYKDVIGFDGTTLNKSISLGAGVAATPSLHVGTEEGAKAFVQSSTGEIEVIEEINLPSPYKSRPLHWIQPGEHSCTP